MNNLSLTKHKVAVGCKINNKFERFKSAIKKNYHYYLLLLIPIIYFLVFKYGPMYGVIVAFRRFRPGGPPFGTTWVGLRYFNMFLNDPTFWRNFKNTLLLSTYSLLIGFPLPIIFALMLNEVKSNILKRFVQTTSYLPHFISMVIIAGMVKQMLSPAGGIINIMLTNLGIIGEPIHFIGKPELFRAIYIISGIWQNLGWSAILYIAALSNVDPQLYEAAMIDGANRWRQTLNVTIPGIMPTIIITLILNIGNLMSVGFEKVMLLYNEMTYPTADVISTYVYRIGLGQGQYSFAAAIGLFDSVIGLILLITANRMARRFSDTSLW